MSIMDDKKPHDITSSPSTETDHVVDSLTPNQRVILLLKLLQDNPSNQKAVDDLVKKILKQENLANVQKLKKEVTDNDKANDIVRGVSPKGQKKPMQIEHQQANTKYIEEYKKFWYENIKKEDLMSSQNKAANADFSPEELKRLSNYVPRLILRRMLSNPNPIKAPEIENYPAAAVFADISGFTPLTEKLASLGLEGIEKLTTVLNAYFGKLIEIIYRHGGDIIKFAGDAVLVVWPTASRAGLGGAILLACQCSKALLNDLGTYEVEGTNCVLRLHIGVGAGEIAGINVGGNSNQFEFFISGQVLEQVSSCEKQAEPGEVFVSAIAWMLVDPGRLIGVQKGKGAFSNYRLDKVEVPADLPPVEELPIIPSMGPALKSYVQAAVKRHVSSGSTRWLAELRNVTVIFLNLTTPFKEYKLPELQNAIVELQAAVYRFEGTVRQFMIDDKGSVLIAGFGLPPLRHEDDPIRAVECALEMYAILQKMQIPCSIGVTTGKAFCGDVGSDSRREYAMVGDIVVCSSESLVLMSQNLSARLMVAAKTNILTDIDTYEACRSYKAIQFEKLEDIRVKGKTNPISIYRPVRSKQRKRGNTNKSLSSSSLGYIANTIVGRDEELKIVRNVVNLVRKKGSSRTINTAAPPALKPNMAAINNNAANQRSGTVVLRVTEIETSATTPPTTPPATPEQDKLTPLSRQNGSKIGNPFLIIEGNEGLGKSRLLKQAEAFARQGKEPITVYTGFGDQLNSTKAYHGWQDILESVLDEKRKVPEHIISLLTPELAPLLNGILPVDLPETDKIRQMSGQLKLEATQQLILKVLRMIIKKSSLVCLDNAQWLDSGSWAVLSAATQMLDGVAFILAIRPTKSVAFQYSQIVHRPNTQVIKLRLLTDAELTLMIAHRLGLKKVPEVISKEIIRRAQGVPFIAEQIVGVIRDSGALQKTKNDELIMTPEIETALKTVPDSVSAVLTSKVDKLNPSQQIVMKVASVIGQTFNVRLLNQLLPQETDKSNIKKDLQSLEKLEMIIPVDPEPDPSFSFANSLLRDVVYGLMLFAQKRQIHKNISEILLKEYAGNSAYYPLMAYHLKQAELDQEAISYYLKSGSLCLAEFANKEAVTFFTEAIQLIDKLNMTHSYEGISMKRKLGQAYYNLGQFDKADEFLRQAMTSLGIEIPLTNQKIKAIKNVDNLPFSNQKEVDHSEVPHRRREAVLILLALTRVHYYACNKPIALFCASLALQLAGSCGTSLLGEAYALSSITCGANSEYKMAESYIAKGIEVAGKTVDVLKVVMQMGGMAYTSSSQWGTAEECFNRAIDAAGTVGDIRTKEESQIFLGYAFFLQGQIEKSIKMINEGLDSSVSRGDPQTQVLALNALAINYYVSGDFDKCVKCLDGVGVALTGGAKDASAEMNYYALMALVHFRMNEIDDSLRCADITFHLLGKLEPTCFFTFTGYALLAEVYIIMSMYPKSHDKKITKQKLLAKGEKAITFLEKFSEIFVFAQPRYFLWKGALNFLNSKQSKASKDWHKGLEIAKQHGLKYEQALILYQRGILTNDSKDITEAGDLVPEIKSRALDLSSLGVRRSMVNPLKDSGEDHPAE